MSRLVVEVNGTPAPQGSKNAVIHRHTGRAVVIEASNNKLRSWRDSVVTAAIEAMQVAGLDKLVCPIRLSVTFRFARPKGHYGTGRNASVLKPGAPTMVAVKPDLSKLVRGLEDALKDAGVYRDDAQIVSYGEVVKVYGERPGATVLVEEISRPVGVLVAAGSLPSEATVTDWVQAGPDGTQ